MDQSNISRLLAKLSDNLDTFTEEVKAKRSTLMATDEWTVKDLLCHIVFWHESYAANYKAMAENRQPPLLEGPGYKLNQDGVAGLRKCSTKELLQRLDKAQDTLSRSIADHYVPQMTYKKNGRMYKTADFLDMVARHVLTHTKHIRKAR